MMSFVISAKVVIHVPINFIGTETTSGKKSKANLKSFPNFCFKKYHFDGPTQKLFHAADSTKILYKNLTREA
jgi:hypothetical protein